MSEEEMLDIIDRIIRNNSLTYFGYNTVQVGYEALEKIVKQYKKQQKEIEEKERQLKIKNEYLQLAHDIAFDYDGSNTTESLKSLIDEIVELINKAYKNDDNSILYIGGNSKKFNILHEEVENE